MSQNGKDAENAAAAAAAAQQHIENNNNINNNNNNNNDLKDTSFTPATPLAASNLNPDTHASSSSSSFIQSNQNPTHHNLHPTNSESISNSNSNSLSRRSLSDVHTLDIHEPHQQQQQQSSTPSTNSKLNSTPHEYTSQNGVPQGHYRNTLPSQDDNFKLFTIYGNGEFPLPQMSFLLFFVIFFYYSSI